MEKEKQKTYTKVRLLAHDSKFPNIALMKISAWHKKNGDDVAWYNPLLDMYDTDKFYHSKIFTFSEDYLYYPVNAEINKGGTGFDITKKLPDEIEEITDLDYSLYPDCDYSLQFLTRGCVRNCGFCVVMEKEGYIHEVQPLALNPKGKYIKLLDNNFFAFPGWREKLEILKNYNQPIDFNQGIDIRTLTEEQAAALQGIKIKNIHCAFDNYKDKKTVVRGLERLIKYVKPYKITVYVLVGYEADHITKTDVERVEICRDFDVNPFAMGYIDFNNPKHKRSKEVKDFCRYVNRKQIFKTTTWEEYRSGTSGYRVRKETR